MGLRKKSSSRVELTEYKPLVVGKQTQKKYTDQPTAAQLRALEHIKKRN
jgi:hypothetical protein